jgi:RNA polymerase sigma-70 factor (ECF subfamily)
MLAALQTQAVEFTQCHHDLEGLLEGCRQGDQSAFRSIYEEYFDFVFRSARRLGLPESDVEDAVQETFHIAFAQIDAFRWGRFSTWLFRITANVVSGRLRKRKVRDFFTRLLGRHEDTEVSPESQVSARATLAQVEVLLRSLSREKREAFALAEIEGLSPSEIAELTGTQVETVRTRLFYARKEFAALAKARGVEP